MIKDYDTAQDFADDFDIVDNALDQRTLERWNGRDFRHRENLSEHTHLVTACAIKLYDDLKQRWYFATHLSFEKIVRLAMIHDSLELLRGDILSVTKDVIPGLRDWVDCEEELFMSNVLGDDVDDLTNDVVKLADMMACYKFVEKELSYPHNKYVAQSYIATKNKFDKAYYDFCDRYNVKVSKKNVNIEYEWAKGYDADAGVDVVLKEDVVFTPLSTNKIDLNVTVTPSEKTTSFLCARTSAAYRGLVVAMCPIDPNFTGTITALVHNVSNDIITYKKGESFCQLVTVPLAEPNIDKIVVKHQGTRRDGKLGSTGI